MQHLLTIALVLAFPVLASAESTPQKMPRHVVLDTLMSHKAALHQCYVDHVPRKERVGSGDNARLKLRIWHDGTVHTAALDDTTLSGEKARSCVLKIAESLRFEKKTVESTLVLIWIGFDSNFDDFVIRLESTPQTRLSSKDVVDAANARMQSFMACYTKRLDEKPALAGKVTLRLVVGASGEIASVDVIDDTLGDEEAVSCMKSVARSLKFEAPGDDAPVLARIPMSFKTR